jgi:hypothetical protein
MKHDPNFTAEATQESSIFYGDVILERGRVGCLAFRVEWASACLNHASSQERDWPPS